MEKVVFVFSGFGGKLCGATHAKVRDAFERDGYTVHFFRNTCKDFFIKGGDDFEDVGELLGFMRAEIDRHDFSVTLCASGGGFGGILHSVKLGVDRIIGFSALTTIDPDTRKKFERGGKLHRRIDIMLPDPKQQNLRWQLLESEFTGSITLSYPENSYADRYQAENLSGCPGVDLLPLPSETHAMHDYERVPFGVLRDSGLLTKQNLIARALNYFPSSRKRIQ